MTIADAIIVRVFMNTPVAWIDPASDIRTGRVSEHKADRLADSAHSSVSEAISGACWRDTGTGDNCDDCGYENGSHGHVLSTQSGDHPSIAQAVSLGIRILFSYLFEK
jgi:hypothetical protein